MQIATRPPIQRFVILDREIRSGRYPLQWGHGFRPWKAEKIRRRNCQTRRFNGATASSFGRSYYGVIQP